MSTEIYLYLLVSNLEWANLQLMSNILKSVYSKYSITVLILSVFISFSLFSCGNKTDADKAQLVFKYNEHKNIGSLDPAFAKDNADIWAVNQLFNGLVQMDENLVVQPCIAKSWSISDDALTYSFSLRNDIQFHKHKLFGKDSTRTVTASDFEYSFSRLLDKKTASPGSWTLNKVEAFTAVNDTLFQIHLKQAFPAFLGLLTMKYCSVVPKEIVEHYQRDFRSNPIGTGPFKFKRWEENLKLVFRRNDNYFEIDNNGKQLPYLEAVAITFLPDKQSEFLQFAQGNIDFVSGLDASYKDEILTANGNLRPSYETDVNMIRGPYLNTEYLAYFMETEIPELQSHLLRKAINFGFDRQKMMTYLDNGIGIPANGGFIPKGLPGFNEIEGYDYQPEKAKQLIADYKDETGDEQPSISIGTNSQYLDLCEYIQRELEKLGIKVTIDVMPPSTLRQMKSSGELDIFRASWIADYPDAENYLSLFYSKNFTPNGPNYTHFKNKRFDELYETSISEVNTETRYELYQQMDSILIEEAPVISLFYDQVIRFSQKNVQGLGINPVDLLDLRRVKKTK